MGLLKSWTDRRQLRAERRSADEQLLASRLPSPRLAWRVAELTSQDHRVELGRAVTDLVRGADERLLPSARPLDRGAIRESRAQLLDLASRMFDTERSVRPRGVLLLEQMLVDPAGPLHGHGEPRLLRTEVVHIRDVLDGTDL